MRILKFLSFLLVGGLFVSLSSCSDVDEESYNVTDRVIPPVMGGMAFKSETLWMTADDDSSVEYIDGKCFLHFPAEGGKMMLTVNPEAKYYKVSSSYEIVEYGPYDVPSKIYPVPYCVYDAAAIDGEKLYYTCSKPDGGLWRLAYDGPLKSPFGKVSMDCNKLTVELSPNEAQQRELVLDLYLCEDISLSISQNFPDFAGTEIYIIQDGGK